MSPAAIHTRLAPYLPHLPQRTASVGKKCLQMSTAGRTRRAPLFVISGLPAAGRRCEGSALLRLDLPPGTFRSRRLPVSHSTHGARVLLVFPTKSLKILLSGGTVSDTNFSKISRNARRPRLAFPRVSRRTRLLCKPSRICSSSWRSL